MDEKQIERLTKPVEDIGSRIADDNHLGEWIGNGLHSIKNQPNKMRN